MGVSVGLRVGQLVGFGDGVSVRPSDGIPVGIGGFGDGGSVGLSDGIPVGLQIG